VDALVHAARERADRFSWATVAAQHLETYERALADA
jgi:hypothetical protein